VFELEDEGDVPAELGGGKDTMINIYKRTVKHMAQ